MKKYTLMIVSIMLVIIAFAMIPSLSAQTKTVPDATVMSAEWVQDFKDVKAGQTFKQYSVPVSALAPAISAWTAKGFNAVVFLVKYDQATDEITLAIQQPDAQILEAIPPCPPYCP